MRWTCPKCGKKLEVSDEQLLAQDGVIVCPQCLLQSQQPLPKVTLRATKATTPPPHKTKAATASPPAYKTHTRAVSTNSDTRRQPVKSKKKTKAKKKKRGMSGWGCFVRSVTFTLLLFAAYVFFGLLLETLS